MPKLSIRLDLKGSLQKKFTAVKNKLGFKTNTSVLIHLINEAYNEANDKGPQKEAV